MLLTAEALNDLADPPVKGLLVYNSNPVVVCPDGSVLVGNSTVFGSGAG